MGGSMRRRGDCHGLKLEQFHFEDVKLGPVFPELESVEQIAVARDPVLHLFLIQDVRVGRVNDGVTNRLNVAGFVDEGLEQIDAFGTKTGEQNAVQIAVLGAFFFDQRVEEVEQLELDQE